MMKLFSSRAFHTLFITNESIFSESETTAMYCIYTQTIKLCLFDVYVCQFQMYERISFKFHFTNFDHLETFCISRADDKAGNTSTFKIESHNIDSVCVLHNPDQFKHTKMFCVQFVCIAFTPQPLICNILTKHRSRECMKTLRKYYCWSSILVINRFDQF